MQPTRGLAFRAAKSHHMELMINKNTPVFSHKIVKPFFPSPEIVFGTQILGCEISFRCIWISLPTSQELSKASIILAVSLSFVTSIDVKTLLPCTLVWLGLSETLKPSLGAYSVSDWSLNRVPETSQRLNCDQTAELATSIPVRGTEMGLGRYHISVARPKLSDKPNRIMGVGDNRRYKF